MNARIHELMEQAKYDDAVFGEGFAGPYTVRKLDAKKFAEMIVKECANIASSIGEHGGFASDEILNHFGVQE